MKFFFNVLSIFLPIWCFPGHLAAAEQKNQILFDQVFFLERYHTANPTISCDKNPYTCRGDDPGFVLKDTNGDWFKAYIYVGSDFIPFSSGIPMIKLYRITPSGTETIVRLVRSINPNGDTSSIQPWDLYVNLEDRLGLYVGKKSILAPNEVKRLVDLIKSTSAGYPTRMIIDSNGIIQSLEK